MITAQFWLSSRVKTEYDAQSGICLLTIPQMFTEDVGEYGCKASNAMGTALSSAQALLFYSINIRESSLQWWQVMPQEQYDAWFSDEQRQITRDKKQRLLQAARQQQQQQSRQIKKYIKWKESSLIEGVHPRATHHRQDPPRHTSSGNWTSGDSRQQAVPASCHRLQRSPTRFQKQLLRPQWLPCFGTNCAVCASLRAPMPSFSAMWLVCQSRR